MKPILYQLSGLLLLISFAVSGQSNSSYFYYYKGEKIPLELNTDYAYLVTTSGISTEEELKLYLGQDIEVTRFSQNNVGKRLRTEASTERRSSEHWAEVKMGENYVEQFSELERSQYISLVAPYFKNETEDKIGLSNYFYVKLRYPYEFKMLLETAEKTNTEIVGQNRFMPLWYTLKCTENTPYNALEAANFFYETGYFAAAQPDLMVDERLDLVPNDPIYTDQWGLNNTGQNGGTAGIDVHAEEAWDITTGDAGIIVAVLDHGFEMDHPDLAANTFGTGFDTESASTPAQILGDHGTACAGIIGAVQDNNEGVSGLAPNTSIMSISNSLIGDPDSRQARADGINWAWQNGAAVISNSWGSGVMYQVIDDAITNAITNGRGGLGTVVVFATGNDDGPVSYPANSNPDIIAVGAMSPCGERKNPGSCDGENWWGGNYGDELDVIAPGVLIPTTDNQGMSGYSNDDYTMDFNGTSSACPHVAGVAALVLSANPALTVHDVNDIIEQSAIKVRQDLYTYSVTGGRPNGTWNNETGYGMVNAHAAVLLAQACQENVVVVQDVLNGESDNQEAIQNITATNTIFANGAAIYHGGNQVLLQPGFHAENGSDFHAYVEGCSGSFESRMPSETVKTQDGIAYVPPDDEQASDTGAEDYLKKEEFVVFPNPFTRSINFKYTVKQPESPVSLKIYNIAGEEITTLVQQQRLAKGTYHAHFDGSALPEGIYIYRLKIGDMLKTAKIVLKR